MESDEIELIQIRDYTYDCCICLNETLSCNDSTLLKMNCCNQTLHKECFLEWIIHPMNKNYNYNNKFNCVICKTKINNFDEIISLGDFINYIQNNKYNKDDIIYYKDILFKLYRNNIITKIIVKSENQNNNYYIETKIYFCIIIMLILLLGNLLVKN